MKNITRLTLALALAAFASAATTDKAKDPVLAYSDAVQDITARLNAKLAQAQPFLVWPGDNLDQDARDKIAWKLEVYINDITKLKRELDDLAVPQGFEAAHKLISGSYDLYMTALSRCGTGIQQGYVKTFNGGVQDYNNASNYLTSGMDELSDALAHAGYNVNK